MTILASQLPKIAAAANSETIVKPPRLQPGDTVGLISPASPVDREDVADAVAAMTQLGLKPKLGAHILDEYGYLAGSDENRAADVNTMFSDATVKAIITMRGGWGCNRILPLLDYNLIRQNPKIIIGFSDITSLLVAIYAQTGMVTFHGPVGISSWNSFSVNYFQRLLFAGESVTLRNPRSLRLQTITSGQARGRLLGGNLSVIASMLGSNYLPDWGQTILFIEEIEENIYSVDRLLTQLKIAGILDKLAGFIFAECTDCTAGEGDEPSLTLNQVLQDVIKPLGIPAWYGAAIGHIRDKFTVPLGVEAEIDARLGTIRLLESAVI